jgi:hypothetical protein
MQLVSHLDASSIVANELVQSINEACGVYDFMSISSAAVDCTLVD